MTGHAYGVVKALGKTLVGIPGSLKIIQSKVVGLALLRPTTAPNI